MSKPTFEIPYDPSFLGDGFEVPVPSLTGRAAADAFDAGLIDYIHYSLSMNRVRRVAAFTAHNIDASRMVKGIGRKGVGWALDERVPSEIQLGSEVYSDNAWDRGHLVRREDVLWGTKSVATAANRATFYYTNAAPQHENFNQDEWLELENWVLHRAPDFAFRLCVFTGPVLTDEDRLLSEGDPKLRGAFRNVVGDVQIPAAFWKVVVLRDETAGGDDLSAVAFTMRQTDMWNDKNGRDLLELKVHQVTLGQIQEWTGVDFGPLGQVDELEWNDGFRRNRDAGGDTPYPVIGGSDDIVFTGDRRRRRGGRAGRSRSTGGMPRTVGTQLRTGAPASPCGCGDSSFDAKTAIASLSRRLEMAIDALSQGRERQVPQAPTLSGPAPDGVSQADWDQATRAIGSTQTGGAGGPQRIVGGTAALPGEFPACVCIGDATQWFCTGSLIHPRIVVTAAHCGREIRRVLVGATRIPDAGGTDGVVLNVERVRMHSYNRFAVRKNDINLVILSSDAAVAPVALASDDELVGMQQTELAGFGYNDPNAPLGFGTLRHATVNLGPIQQAGQDHSALGDRFGYDPATELVAGRKGLGVDSCNGDSGGPAYVDVGGVWKLAGVTSRATAEAVDNCGDGGIYVRPWFYRDWIIAIAKEHGITVVF